MLYFFRLLVFVLGVFSGSAHALIAPVTTGSCQSSKPAHVPAEGTMVGGCGESTPTGNGPLTIVTTSHPSGGTCIAGALCSDFLLLVFHWCYGMSCEFCAVWWSMRLQFGVFRVRWAVH